MWEHALATHNADNLCLAITSAANATHGDEGLGATVRWYQYV